MIDVLTWRNAWICVFVFGLAMPAAADRLSDQAAINSAAKLRTAAFKVMEKDPVEADRLLLEANLVYQGRGTAASWEFTDYLPRHRLKIGDIRGANQAAEDALNRLREMPQYLDYEGGRFIIKGTYVPVTEQIRQVHLFRAEANLTEGDVNIAKRDIAQVIALGLDEKQFRKRKYTSWDGWLHGTTVQGVFRQAQYVAFLNDDTDLIETLQPVFQQFADTDFVETGAIYLAILNSQYDRAIDRALAFAETGRNNKINGRFLAAWSWALKGDTARSEEFIGQMLKSIRVNEQMVARIRALNARNEGQYDKMLTYANEALKPARSFHLSFEQPGKFFFYGLRGDAYAGLKQFENAREQYELALLYNPRYDVAINGLARLESGLQVQRHTDTAPPVIRITEPQLARAVSVVLTGTTVMVRGLAEDPSGINSVRINGVEAYFQANGTFWGETALAAGTNRVTVVATDVAGNAGEQTFEVTHQPAAAPTIAAPAEPVEARNHALIVAAQNYTDANIPSLEKPIGDAIKLKLILKNGYSFADENIHTLFNPTVTDIRKKFAEVKDTVGPADTLIVFYAGHGIWVEAENKGYWLLTDSVRRDVNTWLSNKAMLDMIATIPSQHTLLITDACFSGSVFRTRGLGDDAPVALREMSQKISRVAITSGNDSEVPDESVFMKYLVKALDENSEKYLTAQKMFVNHIIEAVMTETRTEPRYGTLEAAGHVGGDYIFVKR